MNGLTDVAFATVLQILAASGAAYGSDGVTQEDLWCAAQNVYHEAREGRGEDWVAVTSVVINRAWSSRFPDDICEVVYQSKQFSWTADAASDEVKAGVLWEQIVQVTFETLAGQEGDITDGAIYYHAPSVSPYWRSDFLEVGQIGVHIFYAEAE